MGSSSESEVTSVTLMSVKHSSGSYYGSSRTTASSSANQKSLCNSITGNTITINIYNSDTSYNGYVTNCTYECESDVNKTMCQHTVYFNKV